MQINQRIDRINKRKTRYLGLSMCTKKTYYSKKCADTVLKRILDKGKKNKNCKNFKPTRSYKCPLCSFFHLTSQI